MATTRTYCLSTRHGAKSGCSCVSLHLHGRWCFPWFLCTARRVAETTRLLRESPQAPDLELLFGFLLSYRFIFNLIYWIAARLTLFDISRRPKITASSAFEMWLETSYLEEDFKMNLWNISKSPAAKPAEKFLTTREWLQIKYPLLYFQKWRSLFLFLNTKAKRYAL